VKLSERLATERFGRVSEGFASGSFNKTKTLFGKDKKMKANKIVICSVAIASLLSAFAQGAAGTQLFFDDFEGTALDTSKWSVFVDGNGQYHAPYVADGLLHSQGYHTRIDSIPTFAAPKMDQSVMACARINLDGSVNKFGFGLNPNERTGPVTGYYFDTLHLDTTVPLEYQGQEHYVRALAWSNPGDGSLIHLLDVAIPVTWYEFHEFAIERTSSEVIYYIDGQERARVTDTFAGALPVEVWNDRWDGMMLTDWVEVTSVPEPMTIGLLAFGGLLLRKHRR
jgi:hypothetical protein